MCRQPFTVLFPTTSDMPANERHRSHETGRSRRREESPRRLLIRNIMNLYFMVAVAAIIALYFACPGVHETAGYMVFAMFTIAVKIAEMIIRFLPERGKRGEDGGL